MRVPCICLSWITTPRTTIIHLRHLYLKAAIINIIHCFLLDTIILHIINTGIISCFLYEY